MWEGTHEGKKVAVKVLTVYMTSNFGKIKEVGYGAATQIPR